LDKWSERYGTDPALIPRSAMANPELYYPNSGPGTNTSPFNADGM